MLFSFGSISSSLHGTQPPSWAIFSHFIRHRIVVFFGLISYALYLWHWPLVVWFGNPFRQMEVVVDMNRAFAAPLLEEDEGAGGMIDIAIITSSIVLATLSYYFIEMPILSLRNRVSPKRVF